MFVYRLLLRWLHVLERVLAALVRYPLLQLQVVLFFLVAWGRLGYELGAEDLFWSDRIGEQMFNGFACGLLFGEIWLVRYLLDRRCRRFSASVSLFPFADPGIKRLGGFLLLSWLPSLLLLGGGKLFFHDVWAGYVRVWPLYLGLLLAVDVSILTIFLASRYGVLAYLSRRVPARARPATTLHGLALLTAIVSALALVLIYALHFGGTVLSPIVVVCVMLGLANAVYGFLTYWAPGSQYVAGAILIGAGLLISSSVVSREQAYKLTFPHLENCYATPLRLDEEPKSAGGDRRDHYYDLLLRQQNDSTGRPDLIASEEPLRALAERWQNDHHDGSKPRLVLIATSGGGIRAAVWTAVVLEGLEREMEPTFRDHIRMFTGASGGMVGAALYVADFENTPAGQRPPRPEDGLGGLSGELAGDSLRRTVQTMLLHDLPTLWKPGQLSWDRGRELEAEWVKHTLRDDGRSPFQKKFKDLKEQEQQGRCPSLVFAPMLAEDARRLLISNLDLLDLTWTSGNVLGFKTLKEKYPIPRAPDRPLLSLEAVEMFRLFPQAQGELEVGTAGRMNASFPVVSPAVSLPTNPPRHVIDAGYFDDYGVNLAARWLYRYEEAIRKYTSGVVLIEIRAYRNGYARWHFQDREAEKYQPDPDQKGRRAATGVRSRPAWSGCPRRSRPC
jgi:hypothetical protein